MPLIVQLDESRKRPLRPGELFLVIADEWVVVIATPVCFDTVVTR